MKDLGYLTSSPIPFRFSLEDQSKKRCTAEDVMPPTDS